MRSAIATGLIANTPAIASTTSSTMTPRVASAMFRTRCCSSGPADGSMPIGPSVFGARSRYVINPMIIPTPAAPKPQCHPTRSPRYPVRSGARRAPMLIPM